MINQKPQTSNSDSVIVGSPTLMDSSGFALRYLISDPTTKRDLFVAAERTDGVMGMLGRQAARVLVKMLLSCGYIGSKNGSNVAIYLALSWVNAWGMIAIVRYS